MSTACNQQDSSKGSTTTSNPGTSTATPTPKTAEKPISPPAATTVIPTPTPSAAQTATSASATGRNGIFVGLPKTASKVPTVAEWNAAPEIKNLPGIPSHIPYEIKNVREWIKLTFRTNPLPHGGWVPLNPVKVTKGKDGNVFEFTSKNDPPLTSIVFAMIEGKEREAIFDYPGTGKITATANWARGAPEATLKFSFIEAKLA